LVLGFGTQSIDFDNDGLLDIVVTNGHVEDEAQSPAPFRQLPQLFRNMEGRFELIEVTDTSGYWSSKYLGRGLARIDFNRDGRMDCVITHLEAPTALLINQTDSQNHWLQLQLVGTQSERDAIGARVHVKAGNSSSFHWVTAGDGYLCRNELMLPIGLGQATQVEELSIEWPSGITQTIRDIPIDRRLLIIENQTDPVPL
jgi:ASPIC and UnbV/FG-GAP-like repeat